MKKLIAPLLLTATVLLVSGCAGLPFGAPATPTPTATAKAAAPVPAPDAAQKSALLAELSKVNAAYSDDKAVESARKACRAMIGGAPDRVLPSTTQAAFRGEDGKALTKDQAAQVVAIIKANGFCKKV